MRKKKVCRVEDDGTPEMHVNQVESGDVAISIMRNLGGKCGFCGQSKGWLMIFGLKDQVTPKDIILCPEHFNDFLAVSLRFWLLVKEGKMRSRTMEVIPKEVVGFLNNGSQEVQWSEEVCA